MSDAEFVEKVGVCEGLAGNCVAVRRAMASLSKIPPEMIRDTDDVRELCGLMFDGWDQLSFVFTLEKELDMKIPSRNIPYPDIGWKILFWGEDKGQLFGEWTKYVVNSLSKAEQAGVRRRPNAEP